MSRTIELGGPAFWKTLDLFRHLRQVSPGKRKQDTKGIHWHLNSQDGPSFRTWSVPGNSAPSQPKGRLNLRTVLWSCFWETRSMRVRCPNKQEVINVILSVNHQANSCGYSLTRLCPWRRQWHPTPVLLPGKSHGQRRLVGCGPSGRYKSDMIERLHFHFSLSHIGEGNGSPLQCSCLENPRDGGAWWAAVYGVAQGQTQLKWLSSSKQIEKHRF